MFWSPEGIITELIAALSTGLFGYWVLRAVLLTTASQSEIDRVLDSDLRWAAGVGPR